VRVICLVEHPDHVCCRYRLAALRPHLEEQGIHLDLVALPGNLLARLSLLTRLKGRAVILQRKLFSWLELKILRTQAAWLAFDMDDAVFLRDSYSSKGHQDSRRLGRFRRLMALSDCVFAGNHFLAGQARLNGATGTVVVVPTSIEPGLYPVRPKDPNKSQDGSGLQMTWIGSSSTLQGLERMTPLFNRIGAEIPGIRLRVISDRFPDFERLRVVQIPWSGKTEANELAQGDVGISWIPDDPWSRGKCGLKVLQYMAAGLPVLANPVGVHPEMIRPGKEGFLPANDDEWLKYLRILDQDREALHTLGTSGRNRVETEYSVANAARLVANTIRVTAGRAA
jgi:glycosyltransferase involved in cell wall biosynthesis